MTNPRDNASQFMGGGGCCGYPQGCTVNSDACRFMGHPFKRRYVLGDLSAPCNAEAIRPHPETGELVVWRCVKAHDFVTGAGDCEMVPTKRRQAA